MESEIYERLDEEGVEDDDMRMDHELKMRYAGQWRSLDVPCARPIESMEAIREQFHDHHEQVYAYSDADQQVEIYGLRVTGRGIVDKPSFPELDAEGATDAHVGTRDAYFDDAGEYVETDVYDRSKLGAGASFEGPAIVEQMDSTVVVPPGTDAQVERTGNLIITVK
jgi:N-methylhydantoinase A